MRQTERVCPGGFDAWLGEATESNAPARRGAAARAGRRRGQTAAVDGKTSHGGQRQRRDGLRRLPRAGRRGQPGGVARTSTRGARPEPRGDHRDVEPSPRQITPGKPAGVMPRNYGDVLKPEELEALTAYLVDSTKK
jgi:hypothetical protein